MPSSPRLPTACEISPLTVLVRGVLEWACPHSFFEELFDQHCRPKQWNRKLMISAIAWLMLQVVSGVRRSVFAAFQADQATEAPTITASATALYAKYGRIDPNYTTAVVRESARRMRSLIRPKENRQLKGWEQYHVVIFDGTDLAGTEHRLKPLRKLKAAGLPGRYLAAYEPATGLVCDAVASEDAYTSERNLVGSFLESAKSRDLFVADQHFCTTAILFPIIDGPSHFVIRQNPNLRWFALGQPRRVGRVETGEVWEQNVEIEETKQGQRRRLRRIILKLDTPTEDGDTEIILLTNLNDEDAREICRLYRGRWRIEQHFSLVKTVLQGEIQGLGKPRAAIFAMGMALVAANALAVVLKSLRASHGDEECQKLSGYYLADEVAGNYRAIDTLVPDSEWQSLERQSAQSFWSWCQAIASQVRTRALYKHPRGPKKPPPRRASGRQRHHYSTYRLLQQEVTKC